MKHLVAKIKGYNDIESKEAVFKCFFSTFSTAVGMPFEHFLAQQGPICSDKLVECCKKMIHKITAEMK